jgi:octaheme c-type cytochrome (tetrathionate reductase family)
MKRIRYNIVLCVFLLLFGFILSSALEAEPNREELAPGRSMARQATKDKRIWNTTDHSRHKALQQDFINGNEVTNACISCHSEASSQFKKTIHWTWLAEGSLKKSDHGKAGYSVNNFCISTNKMEDKSCFSCHPGWNGVSEDVNCLVCHGQEEINWSESFEDLQYFSEEDDEESRELAAELRGSIQKAVSRISRPTRKNCGECHFKGGGGDGVKHGDLDTSLANPNKALDVHMGVDGQNFDCVRCHTTVLHNIAGRVYTAPAATDRKSLIEDDLTTKITCESCHSATPHKTSSKANDHTDRVACQSCHIPDLARVNPTKMSWDWSKAGKTKDGKPYKTKDEFGQYDYMSIKGEMVWDKNVEPEYFWYNGTINGSTLKDTIDPGTILAVSHPEGSSKDKNSRIYPFKVHRGKQPYDKIHKKLLAPLLSGPDGYWNTLDWQRALKKGMESVGLPYSGEFDFVETTYVFPSTHMVVPKDNVLACSECHVKEGSRLANLTSIYMPGRDGFKAVDIIGWLVILGSFGAVVLHGLGRFFTNGRK